MWFFKGELKCIGLKIGYPMLPPTGMLDDCHNMGDHLPCDAASILLISPISHETHIPMKHHHASNYPNFVLNPTRILKKSPVLSSSRRVFPRFLQRSFLQRIIVPDAAQVIFKGVNGWSTLRLGGWRFVCNRRSQMISTLHPRLQQCQQPFLVNFLNFSWGYGGLLAP